MYHVPTLEIMLTSKCNMNCSYCFEDNKKLASIDINKILEIFEINSLPEALSLFGGEPFIEINSITKIIDFVSKKEPNNKKLIESASYIITNGTLIKKYGEILKKYNIKYQISIDGIKEAHDKSRKFLNGEGSFDIIMENIKFCKDNGIKFSLHGALSKNNISFLFESMKLYFDIYKSVSTVDEAISYFKNNWYQIIFEEEWNDNDVDILILEFHKMLDWIFNNEELTLEQRKNFFDNISKGNTGGICGVGTGFSTIDTELELFPCHRASQRLNNSKYNLGNIIDIKVGNKKMWNVLSRIKMKHRYIYSCCFDTTNNNHKPWTNWCPITNYETSGNIYYQSCKYNVMLYEVNRFFGEAIKSYFPQDQS